MSVMQDRPSEFRCYKCKRSPEQITEYIVTAKEAGMTPSDYVWQEEGTLNPANGHFACTTCYINAGMPVGADGRGGPGRWMAP